MSLYKERELGNDAARVLESEAWTNAWTAYRQRLLEEIEAAPSTAVDAVLHYKRLLSAATAARAHLERIMKEGRIAESFIVDEEKKKRFKLF